MSDKNGLPGGKHTLVEEGTEFKGTLSSKCPIVVMGKVEGDVTGPIIQVTASGVVAGNVKVKELRSEGELAGNVEADTVRIAGRVRDKTVIRARTLEVALTATKGGMQVVFGDCELAIGDEPNKEAAVTAALAASEPKKEPVADPKKEVVADPKKKRETAPPALGGSTAAPASQALASGSAPETTTEETDPTKRRRDGTLPPPVA